MRGRLLPLLGAALGFGLYRALARLRQPAGVGAEAAPDERAAELRRRLDESRAVVGERDEFEAAETPVDRVDVAEEDLARRRARVHEEGRALADRMRRPVDS